MYILIYVERNLMNILHNCWLLSDNSFLSLAKWSIHPKFSKLQCNTKLIVGTRINSKVLLIFCCECNVANITYNMNDTTKEINPAFENSLK